MIKWKDLLRNDRPGGTSSTGDHRVEFERDYDRTVFCTPVKRLQDKTQVFPLERNDAIRNRLTHTLEVSTVSRGIAMAVGDRLKLDPDIRRSIEAICATVGVIHDLGNPPFGHAGETAIRDWFKEKRSEELAQLRGVSPQLACDFEEFEGNAQSLRLVRRLQVLGAGEGLNLTFGTLSACMKYTAASNCLDKDSANAGIHKPGYFASENDEVSEIREKVPLASPKARNPLAYVVEAADDIVNSTADIEDAVKRKALRWKDVEENLDMGDAITKGAYDFRLKILRSDDVSGFDDDDQATAFRTAAIGAMVKAVTDTFESNQSELASGSFSGDLITASAANTLYNALKGYKESKVLSLPAILKLELTGNHVLGELMDIFWQGATALGDDGLATSKGFASKAGCLISPNYRKVYAQEVTKKPKLKLYYQMQLLSDYICGMTDGFAIRLHSELTHGRD